MADTYTKQEIDAKVSELQAGINTGNSTLSTVSANVVAHNTASDAHAERFNTKANTSTVDSLSDSIEVLRDRVDTLLAKIKLTGTSSYNITGKQRVAISTITLDVVASNGQPVYYQVVGSVPLPTGVSLVNGIISGTPTIVYENKLVEIQAYILDTDGVTKLKTFAISVLFNISKSQLSGTTSYTRSGSCGTAISPIVFDVVSDDGTAVTYAVTGGELPAGLTLSNGQISGTPTATHTGDVVVTASAASTGATLPITINLTVTKQQVKLANNFGLAYTCTATSISITWTDPTDINTATTEAVWKQTKIIRKIGSAPTGTGDGTLVATITSRNQHQSTAWVDTVTDDTQVYYYGFFAETVGGTTSDPDVSSSSKNTVALTPVSVEVSATTCNMYMNAVKSSSNPAIFNYGGATIVSGSPITVTSSRVNDTFTTEILSGTIPDNTITGFQVIRRDSVWTLEYIEDSDRSNADANDTGAVFVVRIRSVANTNAYKDVQVTLNIMKSYTNFIDVRSLHCTRLEDTISLTWENSVPADTDSTHVEWVGNYIIRKTGSAPTGVTDFDAGHGYPIIISAQDQHKTTAWVDNNGGAEFVSGTKYYYCVYTVVKYNYVNGMHATQILSGTEGVQTSNTVASASYPDITIRDLADILASGDLSSVVAGSVLDILMADETTDANRKINVIDTVIDTGTSTSKSYARYSSADTDTCYAWMYGTSKVIYTRRNFVLNEGETVYSDNTLKTAAGVIAPYATDTTDTRHQATTSGVPYLYYRKVLIASKNTDGTVEDYSANIRLEWLETVATKKFQSDGDSDYPRSVIDLYLTSTDTDGFMARLPAYILNMICQTKIYVTTDAVDTEGTMITRKAFLPSVKELCGIEGSTHDVCAAMYVDSSGNPLTPSDDSVTVNALRCKYTTYPDSACLYWTRTPYTDTDDYLVGDDGGVYSNPSQRSYGVAPCIVLGASTFTGLLASLEEGTLLQNYNFGDTFDVMLTDNTTMRAMLVGYNHDTTDGIGNTARLEFLDEYPTQQVYDAGNSSVYDGSDVDLWLSGTFYPLLPSVIKDKILSTQVSATSGSYDTYATLSRQLFLPSVKELGGTSGADTPATTGDTSYACNYYQGINSINANTKRVKYKSGATYAYWTRTPSSSTVVYFDNVYGYVDNSYFAYNAHGVAPTFNIGKPYNPLADLLEAVRNGTLTTQFNYGDTFSITLTDGTVMRAMLVAYDHDTAVAQSGESVAHNARLEFLDTYPTLQAYDAVHNSVYDGSDIDTWLTSTFYPLLPTGLRNTILKTNISAVSGSYSTYTTLQRLVFLPSVKELGGVSGADTPATTGDTSYACNYYQGINSRSSNTKRVKYKSGATYAYWTRTPSSSTVVYFVDTDGNVYNHDVASDTLGVAPAFVIG